MSKKGWLVLWSAMLIGILAIDQWVASAEIDQRKERNYVPPSTVRYDTDFTDEQLLQLARYQAREVVTTDGRLGVIEPGKKGLITVPDDQDLRVMKACIKALRERGADADYIYTSDLLEMYGYPREWASPAPTVSTIDPSIAPMLAEIRDYFSGSGVEFFSERLQKVLPKANEELMLYEERVFVAKLESLKHYLKEHPEYDYVFLNFHQGGPRFSRLNLELGSKFQVGWRITNVASLVGDTSIPSEINMAVEDKIVGVIPWLQHVRITDPEGTDLEFSLSHEDAQDWRKGAYMADYLRIYPLQACRYLYPALGSKRVVAPEAKGTIAGTSGRGYYPRMVMTVENGMVQKIEGGGLKGEMARDLLTKYKDYHLPFLPHPGWFYVYQIMLMVSQMGVVDWGFGVELYIPEIVEYTKQHGVPNAHDNHLLQHFMTWEGTVGGGRKIKLLDKGYLTAYDDPEVRLIASKFGDPDELLRPLNRIAMPGINAPGSYEEYAKDPYGYMLKVREQIKDGSYPYLIKLTPRPLQAR